MGDLISSVGSFFGTPGGAAVIGGLGSVAGGLIGANASSNAANLQSQSANQALQVQQGNYAQTRNDLLPYNQAGQGALPGLTNPLLTGFYNGGNPFSMSQQDLENTAGYKFNMSQGLEATQNAAAARGLGVSGAALKGAANYASGLADSTYQNQAGNYYQGAQNYYTAQNNAFNKLYGIAQLGENAGATSGSLGQQYASNAGNLITGSGNAQAAGTIGGANAISNGLSGVGNNLMQSSYLNLLTGQQNQATTQQMNSGNSSNRVW